VHRLDDLLRPSHVDVCAVILVLKTPQDTRHSCEVDHTDNVRRHDFLELEGITDIAMDNSQVRPGMRLAQRIDLVLVEDFI
jgi:hypothetical protein